MFNTNSYSISLLQQLLKVTNNNNYKIFCENYPEIELEDFKNYISQKDFQLLNSYEELEGNYYLRELIAERESKKYGYKLKHKNIIMTNGATHALYCIYKMMLKPNDEVILNIPAFSGLAQIAESFHINLIGINVEDIENNIDKLKEKITSRTKMIILNSPHNPTGKIISNKLMQQVLNICLEYSILLIHDEVYDDLIYTSDCNMNIRYNEAINFPSFFVKINSFSKNYGLPGIRIGWIVAEERIVYEIEKVIDRTILSVNPFSQKIAIELLKYKYKKIVETCKKRRDFLIRQLSEIPCLSFEKPEAGTIIYTNISKLQITSLNFIEKIYNRHNIFLLPSEAYFGGDCNHIRLSFGYSENKILQYISSIKNTIEEITT